MKIINRYTLTTISEVLQDYIIEEYDLKISVKCIKIIVEALFKFLVRALLTVDRVGILGIIELNKYEGKSGYYFTVKGKSSMKTQFKELMRKKK